MWGEGVRVGLFRKIFHFRVCVMMLHTSVGESVSGMVCVLDICSQL